MNTIELYLDENGERSFSDRFYNDLSSNYIFNVFFETKDNLENILKLSFSKTKQYGEDFSKVPEDIYNIIIKNILDDIFSYVNDRIDSWECKSWNINYKEIERGITLTLELDSILGNIFLIKGLDKKKFGKYIQFSLKKYKIIHHSISQIESILKKSTGHRRGICRLLWIIDERIEQGSFTYLDYLFLNNKFIGNSDFAIFSNLYEKGFLTFGINNLKKEKYNNIFLKLNHFQMSNPEYLIVLDNIMKYYGMNFSIKNISFEKNRLTLLLKK